MSALCPLFSISYKDTLMTTPNPYCKFLWIFGLLMPIGIALLLLLVLTMFYGTWIDAIIADAVFWLAMLPASFLIAWLAARRRCTRNLAGILLTTKIGFAVALAYEFLIMILTDIITHQVGSYFHREVLYIALIAAASSFLAAACLLPRNTPPANKETQ